MRLAPKLAGAFGAVSRYVRESDKSFPEPCLSLLLPFNLPASLHGLAVAGTTPARYSGFGCPGPRRAAGRSEQAVRSLRSLWSKMVSDLPLPPRTVRSGGATALLAAVTLLLGSTASAQAPAPAVAPRRADLPEGRSAVARPDPVVVQLAARADHLQLSRSLADVPQAIDQCVAADMRAHNTPGATVAVMLDGALLFQKGYGVKHRRNGGTVDAATVFRIGSITKMMTAAAVMQQVEAGRVHLNDPVTALVPEFEIAGPWPADRIAVRHLLSHTTGFPDRLFGDDIAGPTTPGALSNWAASQTAVSLHAPPGAFWNYSNPNFALAGLVAERASGINYQEYMEPHVWGPAGMSATTLSPAKVVAGGNWTYGHHTNVREFIYRPDSYDNWEAAPAGFAFSTAPDLVRWADLLMAGGGGVLQPASAEEMQSRQAFLNYTPDLFYGFGIMSESYRGLDLLSHGGNVPGWGSMLMWVPERRFAVAVLANTFESLTAAAYCIVDAVLQPSGPPPPDYTTDPSTWAPYLGTYDITDVEGSTFRAQVGFVGSDFLITFLGLDGGSETYTTPLVQLYLDTFGIDSDEDSQLDMDLTFIRSEAGPARWLRNRLAVGARRSSLRGRADSQATPGP